MALDYDADKAAAELERLAAIERRMGNKATPDHQRGLDFGAAEALRRRGASAAVRTKAEDLAGRLRKKLPAQPAAGTRKHKSLLDPDVTVEY
jgi:hypothetical protein